MLTADILVTPAEVALFSTASRGFSLQQILNADSVGRAKKVARRYANPANKNQAWSGHGKRPQWVASHLASGGKLADLEVKSDA